ncbi:von Willebrand factor type A domain-containing protein [Lutibacter sp. Hel_I_33_5]|uniref:vWA domain-containing protein n=1 Tax=Lutibacter sp. Hel_I_33_5 TaxID=1566289 RepID=UPI0011A7E442|nr:vWA domain-containing protein [Lutibacter sp. Hel_I_33_5]TVZ56775.1 von Willebrand factor type A domain-containing protein [Lutibacter sp. Hel_I_33_5]
MKLKAATICLLLLSSLSFATNKTEKENTKKQTIKVALLLDTSNSMDGLINQAKTKLWEIVNELSYAKYGINKPNLEIALYEYGNDKLAARNGFIRRVLHFSSDLDEISEKLFSLTTNGGSEFCGQVIKTSLKELEWGRNKKDLRLIFIAGNEPFTQGKINYKEAISDAKEKDIIINTIFCGRFQNGVAGKWQDGANSGGGDYMTINHNKRIVHIVTPFDDEIIICNKKLNKTYIYYGSKGHSKFANQFAQDNNAEALDEVVAVKRAVSKSSRLYKNSSWDLVDAEEEKEIDYTNIKKEQLPKHLKNKSSKEIKAYVKEQAKKRKEIQQKIQELNKKRRKYIAENQKNKDVKNIDNLMIKAIKRQAKLKNYSW